MRQRYSVKKAQLLRTFTFGVEDSLVSTAGLVTGIAAGGVGRAQIIIAGVVLIFVEAFSMGVGSFLSERSSEEFKKHKEVPIKKTLPAAMVMFVTYFLTGIVPLAPYAVLGIPLATAVSIMITLAALFGLGAATAKFAGIKVMREAMEMGIIGGAAILIGVVVGWLMKTGV